MVENDRDQLRDHEYDGIREYDNRLPNWWLYTLYGSIAFAALYWLWLHTWGFGLQQQTRYEREMSAYEQVLAEAAESRAEVTDASLLALASDPARLAAGREIFDQYCVACHLADGSGLVGPNLTDGHWIHGGAPLQIRHIITVGVPEPRRVEDVTAYILTMKGKNLPGKAPEGELETPTAREAEGPAAAEPEEAAGS
jgi:cytochrome c oxidase cbb3-type subunit 3